MRTPPTRRRTRRTPREDQASSTDQKLPRQTAVELRGTHFETLAEIGQRILSIRDIDSLLQETAELLVTRFGFYHVLVLLADEERGDLIYRAGAGRHSGEIPIGFRQRKEEGLIGAAASQRTTIVSNEAERDPRRIARFLKETKSEVAVPILHAGQLLGVLDVHHLEAHSFSPTDVRTLETVGNQLGIALQNARLLQAAEARSEEARLLFEASRAISRSLRLEETLDAIFQSARKALRLHDISIYIVDEARSELVEFDRAVDRGVVKGERMPLSIPSGGQWTFQRREVLVSEDCYNDPRVNQELVRLYGSRAMICAPLLARGEPIGVMYFEEISGPRHWTPLEVRLAEELANEAALAIERAQLYEKAQTSSDQASRRSAQIAGILGATTAFLLERELDHLLQQVASALVETFGFSRASVMLLDPRTRLFQVRALAGDFKGKVPAAWEHGVPDESALVDLSELTRVGLNAYYVPVERQAPPDRYYFLPDPEAVSRPRRSQEEWHPRDYISILLRNRSNQIIGLLFPDDPLDGRVPSKETLEVLEIFGGLVAIAIENALLFRGEQEARTSAELLMDVMAHDISNYNMAAIGNLTLLSHSRNLTESERRYVQSAYRQVQYNSALIADVRTLARARTGRPPAQRPMDLSVVIRDALTKTLVAFPDRHVIFALNLPQAGAPCAVDDLLSEVFLNLFANAIKHDPKPTNRIEVSARRVKEREQDWWRVEVADHGSGIPESLKGQLFRRFGPRASTAQGTGLGLSIVRAIVEGYGGRVWVEDRVLGDSPQGARFCLLLPVAKEG